MPIGYDDRKVNVQWSTCPEFINLLRECTTLVNKHTLNALAQLGQIALYPFI